MKATLHLVLLTPISRIYGAIQSRYGFKILTRLVSIDKIQYLCIKIGGVSQKFSD